MSYAYLLFIIIWIIPLINASALPQQTSFTSSTGVFLSGAPATISCPTSCRRKIVDLSSISWSSLAITATITAETVLFRVNKQTNRTLTTTITNTEVDLKAYTPVTDLNSAGTRTTAIVVTNGNAVTTHTVAFPTTYTQDYPSDYTICGTLSTTLSGVATCIEHPCVRESVPVYGLGNPTGFDSGAPSFTLPSHPPYPPSAWPTPTMSDLESDPKGLTYEPVWESVGNDWYWLIQSLFPSLGAWNCDINEMAKPATVKATALYLTATSTVMETHLPSESPTYSSETLPAIHDNGASQAPATSSSPFTSKPEEAATTLPETSPGNAPKSTATTQIMSANGGHDSKQTPSDRPAGAATASSGVANNDVPASAAGKTSPTKTVSSEQVPSLPLSTSRLPPIAPLENPGQASATPSVGTTARFTDERGHVVASVAQLPALILTSTNPEDSPIATTSPLIESAFAIKAAPIVFNSHTILTDANSKYIVAGQPLTLGVSVMLGSGDAATPVVIHTSSSHTILIVGSSTSTFIPSPTVAVAAAPAPALTISSQILSANPEGQYVAGSQTLAPGSPITLGSGSAATSVLLRTMSSKTVLVIGPSTSTLIAAPPTTPQHVTIGSQVVSANSQDQYIVGSQTLAPGSPITLGSGPAATPISLQTSGTQTLLIAGSITSTLAAAVTAPPPFTIGSQAVTANDEDQYVIGSQTLTPGGAITVSGTPVSLAPSGTQVLVGTSTEGLGDYIMSGLGTGPSGSASNALPFTGAAGRQSYSLGTLAIGLIRMVILMLCL